MCASLVQNVVCTYSAYVEKCGKGFVWIDRRKKTDVCTWKPRMATLTRKCKYKEFCWFFSRFSLAVCCVGFSAFHFPIVGVLGIVAITTTHYTLHHHTHECGMAWHRRHVQRISIMWHGRLAGWLVGRCTCSRRPRLTQAYPNYIKMLVNSCHSIGKI